MGSKHPLDYIFHPSSIAVVGASPSNLWSPANIFFLNPLIEFGYEGNLYPIHPKAREVSGLKTYPSIRDVPGSVDYVLCAIAAHRTPQLMKECVAKGVKVISLFTAGFSESGEEKGIRLEEEITEIARKGGIRVIGPNCIGIYCPDSKLTFMSSAPKESGGVGVFCQSGGNSLEIVQYGEARGIRFSKVISFGNAADLNEADFLEYFIHDSQTKIIAAYVEGTKQGGHFLKLLHQAVKTKPVIMLKGGITEGGFRAVASHTGALAGNNATWKALFHQTGVIQAEDIEELLDLALLFQCLIPPRGRRVGIIGSGGGLSVQTTDDCEKEGLIVPPLPQDMQQKLRKLILEASPSLELGTSMRNPIDLSMAFFVIPHLFPKALNILDNHEGIDFILIHAAISHDSAYHTNAQIIEDRISAVAKDRGFNKPAVMVLHGSGAPEIAQQSFNIQQRALEAGIPVYATTRRAARTLNKFIQYYEARSSRGIGDS